MSEALSVRLANDLLKNNVQDASMVLQCELHQQNPAVAMQELNRANYMAGIFSPLAVGRTSDGQLAIVKRESNQYDGSQFEGRVNNNSNIDLSINLANGRLSGGIVGEARSPKLDVNFSFGQQRPGQANRLDNVLAHDLVNGDVPDALRVISQIERENPRQANEDIRISNELAKREAAQFGRRLTEQVAEDAFGDLTIVDGQGRPIARAGRIGAMPYPGVENNALNPQTPEYNQQPNPWANPAWEQTYLNSPYPYAVQQNNPYGAGLYPTAQYYGNPYYNPYYEQPLTNTIVNTVFGGLFGGHRHHR